MKQEEGLIGKLVGEMIRRSVRARLRNLSWRPPTTNLPTPVIFYVNHHGWLDGYVMFHAITKLNIRCVDWIEEFDSFPLFAKIGGMRFAKGDIVGRVKTVRNTIRLMCDGRRSLVLFPEGVLHRPPKINSFGKSLETVATRVPGVTLVPVAIYYELSMHERPEAWVAFGTPHLFDSLDSCQANLNHELLNLRQSVADGAKFDVLASGTPSVNERMNLKRFRKP